MGYLPVSQLSYLWVVHEVFECAGGCVKNEVTPHKVATDFIFFKVKKAAPSLKLVTIWHSVSLSLHPGSHHMSTSLP